MMSLFIAEIEEAHLPPAARTKYHAYRVSGDVATYGSERFSWKASTPATTTGTGAFDEQQLWHMSLSSRVVGSTHRP